MGDEADALFTLRNLFYLSNFQVRLWSRACRPQLLY
jgi:hypothetical protein